MKTNYIKPIYAIVFTVFLSGNAIAQERYRVTYDYQTEEVKYLKLNKNGKVTDTLENSKIKRNSLVELKLRNVNPFAIQVQTDVKEEELFESGQGFNFSSLLGGIKKFTDDDINLHTSNLPDTDAFETTKDSASRGKTRAAVDSDFEDLNNTITNVSALKTTLVSNLLNPNLDKETILKNLLETADKEIDVRLPSAKDNFYVYLAKVEKSIKDSRSQLEGNLNAISNDIEASIENEDISISRGELVSRNIALSDLQRLMTNLNRSTEQSLQNLEVLRSLYTTLEASNFEQTYDYELSADKVNIELKFVQSEFSNSMDSDNTQTTLKKRNIKLLSKGGFKINTSVAMTLNNFGSSSNKYYLDNGVIGADKNDFFVPNLSTMINFYPFMGENFNLGGSFGLSIPISSNETIEGVNFLFGPSMFFGSKSRLSLSGGLAYGPVKQLTNGLSVGDTTNFDNVTDFTRNVYDFGYYFGISFSLFDLN
ncbi:hypothetical protein [Winogradskyella ouciana]|uniref:Outer membrane protein beta-barrel domain-containing protein n=1 Tax=Winogradskyella ouciana TaxID=2608631 RepID=A0A7K1GGK9_9FLAO|nr:hypothetical protein [Winogradskyella ouciana]MTE28253.1 hypothetical protein [Winogradskyella ouciana]